MRILKGEGGQTTIFAALFMGIVMLGFLAFALDVGYLFQKKRMAQAAADAAVIAFAEEYTYESDSTGDATAAAKAAAKMNGFDTTLSTNPAQVTPSYPVNGNYNNQGSPPPGYVQVTVSQPIPTFFMGGFKHMFSTVTVGATAVSGGGQISPTCVCLEGTTGTDLNMSNGAILTGGSCGVTADSSSSNAITIVGSAQVCAQSLNAVSSSWDNSTNINNGGKICSGTDVVQGLQSACNPVMPATPTIPSCVADPTGGNYGTFTVGPSTAGGTVCYKSLKVGANGATVTLNPGVYVISGGTLEFESGANNKSNLGGDGVMFYLTNGANVVFDQGANVNLVAGGNPETSGTGAATAPSVGGGTYNGILIYEDPGNTSTGGSDAGDSNGITFAGGANSWLNGSIYAPLANVTMNNGSSTTVYADVVAKSLTMAGGGNLQASAQSNLGTSNSSVARLSQ